jgi:hypothetical protein
VEYDSMTERNRFYYAIRGKSKSFQDAWSSYVVGIEHRNTAATPSSHSATSATSMATASSVAEIPAATQASKKGAGSGKGKRPRVDDVDDGEAKRQKKELDVALAEAGKIKALYMTAYSGAQALLSLVATNPEYSWAQSQVGPISAALADVQSARSAFFMDLIALDVKDLRKKYPSNQLKHEALKVPGPLKDKTEALNKEVQLVKRMHAVRR